MAVFPQLSGDGMPRTSSRAIAEVATGQLGLITRRQLRLLGLSGQAIDRRIRCGGLALIHPGVYAIAGVPLTWEVSLLAALLAAGSAAVASHCAAGRLYELEGVAGDRLDVLIPHDQRIELVGVYIHRTRVLPKQDVRIRGPFRVTSPARALVDLAGVLMLEDLERASDDALRRRIVTLTQIRDCLDRRGPNGVKGWARLDRLVRERTGTAPTGSAKETAFLRALRRRKLPVPVKQYRIVDPDGRFVARPDFAYPELRIAIEVDSGFHLNPRQRRIDLRRQNKLQLVAWRVLYFDQTDPTAQAVALSTIEDALRLFGESERR
jgi:very-short-patch-repair endonuclease